MDADVAAVAQLLADEARASAISLLMSGGAHSAGDLARAAGVSPPTMTSHLKRLLDAGVVSARAEGRHRYYSLADPRIATAFEALAAAAPRRPASSLSHATKRDALALARTCYDHLAGRVGVGLTQKLLEAGAVRLDGAEYVVTRRGERRLTAIGVDVDECRTARRRFAYPCLDWTERTHHIGGALGAGLLDAVLRRRWVDRRKDSRALRITTAGRTELGILTGLPLVG